MSDGGFPVYIPQLGMPAIAVWAECPAGSTLKTLRLFLYGAAQISYKITFLLNCFSSTVYFLPQLISVIWELSAGMFFPGVFFHVFVGVAPQK